jgi:hypothetical protein
VYVAIIKQKKKHKQVKQNGNLYLTSTLAQSSKKALIQGVPTAANKETEIRREKRTTGVIMCGDRYHSPTTQHKERKKEKSVFVWILLLGVSNSRIKWPV